MNKAVKRAAELIPILLFAIFAVAAVKVSAAGSVSVISINYEESYMTVQMGAGDTVLQVSDGKQKKWETVTAEPEGGIINLDISWISMSKDYTLSLRGDESTTPITVVIPKQDKNLKVTYSPKDGLSFSGQGDKTLQWKKKDGIRWMNCNADPAEFNKKIDGMIAKGCILMFRTAPVNGDGSSAGARPGKEVTVTIKAKAAAPVISIDDSQMTISLKKNMEYRYCNEKGDVEEGTAWNLVEENEEKALSSFASKAMSSDNNDGETVYIQFRMIATEKTQISNITTLTIPGQKPLSDTEKNGIKLEYVSATTVNLYVNSATEKNQFEYCIISAKDMEEGISIDDSKKLKRIAITDKKAVPILKSASGDGSKIYIRRKAVGKAGDDNYALASPWFELPELKFPKDLSNKEEGVTWCQTTEGMCRPDNQGKHISFTTYSTVESLITEIKFVKFSDTSEQIAILKLEDGKYTCEVSKLSDAEISNLPEEKKDYVYLITTTITDTESLESSIKDETGRKMLMYFKQGASTEFGKDALTGLSIIKKSVIKNPANNTEASAMNAKKTVTISGDHGEYLTNFTRVYNSKKLYMRMDSDWTRCDPNVFSTVINLGTKYILNADPSQNSGTPIEITKIVYDGVEFNAGEKNQSGNLYFVQNFVDTTDDSSNESRSIILTVDTWAMEKNSQLKPKDTAIPLYIYLSNGEVLDDIKINFIQTAFVVSGKDSETAAVQTWSITGLRSTSKTVTQIVNGVSTSIVVEDDVEKEIWLKLYDANTNAELESVTYDGKSICKNISRDGAYIKAEISNSLLNTIIETISSKTSKMLKFTFDNGFVLNEGFKIIINP